MKNKKEKTIELLEAGMMIVLAAEALVAMLTMVAIQVIEMCG